MNSNTNKWITTTSEDISVTGIYMPNGIFSETEDNKGISYILDHLLFEKMTEHIENAGKGYVRAFTQYGYSGFNVICAPEMCDENLQNMMKIITDSNLETESIGNWVAERRALARKHPIPTDTLYFSRRIPGTPLGQTLSGALKQIPSQEELLIWRKRYYQQEIYFSCIDKRPAVLSGRENNNYPHLPQFEPVGFNLPRHIPWRQSHMIMSFDCKLETDELLSAEALCQWITPFMRSIANRRNARLLRVQISPLFVSELQISFQSPRGKEQAIAEDVLHFLHSAVIDLKDTKLCSLQNAVFCNYSPLQLDPLEWNRFRGESALFYGKNIVDTLDYSSFQKYITADLMQCILSRVQSCSAPSLFATAVR